MTMDFFGETHIKIKGDTKLNDIANRVYQLYQRSPELFKGESIGALNRKIHLELMLDDGLRGVIPTGSIEQFRLWYCDKQKNSTTEEECARAFRELVHEGKILLEAHVILKAERDRQRISGNMKG